MAINREKAFEKLTEIINKQLNPKEKINVATRFSEDLGADSLDLVEITMEIEETFDIKVPDETANKIKTVGDAVAVIIDLSSKK